MNCLPWPNNPAVGQMFEGRVWNGTVWVPASRSGAMRVNTVFFGASGTYMPSAGLVTAIVECCGGGGGGGTIGPYADAAFVYTGGGGGSGGYSRMTCPAALVLGGVIVTIGAGGTASAVALTQSGNGETTSFGALCQAAGGQGSNTTAAGPGAEPGVGDVVFPGSGGQFGQFLQVPTGFGPDWAYAGGGMGGTLFGGNSLVNVGVGQAMDGENGADHTGSGGQGGGVNQVLATAPAVGGNGGSGFCIVTEYIDTGAGGGGGGGGDECNPCWPNIPPNVCWPRGGWDDC